MQGLGWPDLSGTQPDYFPHTLFPMPGRSTYNVLKFSQRSPRSKGRHAVRGALPERGHHAI